MKVLIGRVWPHANSSLHFGHIAGLLPGDILARYFRLKDITDRYHKEFDECFKALGFSYDCYSRTDSDIHRETVQEIFKIPQGTIYDEIQSELKVLSKLTYAGH